MWTKSEWKTKVDSERFIHPVTNSEWAETKTNKASLSTTIQGHHIYSNKTETCAHLILSHLWRIKIGFQWNLFPFAKIIWAIVWFLVPILTCQCTCTCTIDYQFWLTPIPLTSTGKVIYHECEETAVGLQTLLIGF